MYSRKWKVQQLFDYFMRVSRQDINHSCPFGKEIRRLKENNLTLKMSCGDLCGAFPELGNAQAGCPCDTLGERGAMNQLEYLLIKEGYLYSNGKPTKD
jgi:hypothetical protein